MPDVDLAMNANLIIATMDLQLVKLLRGAIRTADLSAASSGGRSFSPADSYATRRVIHPEPRYEARPVIHPTPRYEMRPVERSQPTNPDLIPPLAATCAPEPSHLTPSPIQPPWATLPWQNPTPPARIVKVFIHRPDIASKGTMIDCFI